MDRRSPRHRRPNETTRHSHRARSRRLASNVFCNGRRPRAGPLRQSNVAILRIRFTPARAILHPCGAPDTPNAQ
jgi:hypothetical protein